MCRLCRPPPSAEAEQRTLTSCVQSTVVSQSRMFNGTNLNVSVQFGAHPCLCEGKCLIIPQDPYHLSYDHKGICYRKGFSKALMQETEAD